MPKRLKAKPIALKLKQFCPRDNASNMKALKTLSAKQKSKVDKLIKNLLIS